MASEWTAKVKTDGTAVKVYRWGEEERVIKAGAETFKPATAMKFAEKLCQSLAEQSVDQKTADHDVQDEPNLKTDAKGTAVTGKPSPTMSTQQDKVSKLSKLSVENKKLRAKMAHMQERHQLEIKARRGAKLAEFLISQGSLKEDEKVVTAFVKDVTQMTDDEIDRLERKVSGKSEFESAEEAERAEASYRRHARILRRQAEDAHISGDVNLAEEVEGQALDADKNADCCRSFVRAAAHPKVARDKDDSGELCEKCSSTPCACAASSDGTKTADSAVQDAAKGSKDKESEEKDAAQHDDLCEKCECDPCTCDDKDSDEKNASDDGEADEAASDDDAEKTADHDVQDSEQMGSDSKGGAVTGKPSPNLNDGKKKASDEEDTEDTVRDQHLRMATYYRKKADAAERQGDLGSADTFDHKADICEDLAKDSSTETINPEPELAGMTGAKEAAKPMCEGCGKPSFACTCGEDDNSEGKDAGVDDSDDRDASVDDDGSDTHGPETGSAKTATEEDSVDNIPMEMIEAAVTSPDVAAMRSANRGQRRNEPSRASVEASGVMRIASVEENSMSKDSAVVELESLWSNPSRDEEDEK